MKNTDRLSELKRSASDYQLATGVDCQYVEFRQRSLPYEAPLPDGAEPREDVEGPAFAQDGCQTCVCLERQGVRLVDCRQTHLLAAYQAERFGGSYLYFCRLSLLHWASPVILDGRLQGAFVAGPVTLFPIDDLYYQTLRDDLGVHEDSMIRISTVLREVQLVTPERARSLAQLLFRVSIGSSDLDAQTFFADRQAFEQQSRIGEYLQYLKTMEGQKCSDFDYPMEKERELLRFVAEGNKHEAQRLLDQILGVVLYTSTADIDMVKSRVLELAVLLSRAAVEGGADVEQVFGLNYHHLVRIRQLHTIEDISALTMNIMDRFIDLVFDLRNVQHTHSVLQVVRFVKQHFSQTVTLSDAAEHVHLSPSYVSKLFKHEMGRSFSEYLTKVRIDEARRLLLDSDMSLGDVAFACGFEDQSYFTKVFKKQVGIPPSRYRDNEGRIY